MSTPKISIVTISYNQGAFLEKTIRSVLEQEYPDLEYIVIDGGSTDGSVDIIRKYEDRLTYWVSEKDRGQSHALNKGFDRCSGDLLGWLNSDDYFLPRALERFAAAWRAQPDAGGWVGRAHLVDETGRTVKEQGYGDLSRDGLAEWVTNGFSQPACLFSRAAWDKVKPVDESLYVCLDFDLWMKIAGQFEFVPLDATLAAATIHPAAKTQAHKSLMLAERWLVLMRYGYDELVKKTIQEEFSDREQMLAKIERITRLPLYRLVRPLVRAYVRRGRRSSQA